MLPRAHPSMLPRTPSYWASARCDPKRWRTRGPDIGAQEVRDPNIGEKEVPRSNGRVAKWLQKFAHESSRNSRMRSPDTAPAHKRFAIQWARSQVASQWARSQVASDEWVLSVAPAIGAPQIIDTLRPAGLHCECGGALPNCKCGGSLQAGRSTALQVDRLHCKYGSRLRYGDQPEVSGGSHQVLQSDRRCCSSMTSGEAFYGRRWSMADDSARLRQARWPTTVLDGRQHFSVAADAF